MTSPTFENVEGFADLLRATSAASTAVTVAIADAEEMSPLAVFVDAVAVLVREPASKSACVIACVAVQVVDAPGANGPAPQGLIDPSLSSEIANGPDKVMLLEFVTV